MLEFVRIPEDIYQSSSVGSFNKNFKFWGTMHRHSLQLNGNKVASSSSGASSRKNVQVNAQINANAKLKQFGDNNSLIIGKHSRTIFVAFEIFSAICFCAYFGRLQFCNVSHFFSLPRICLQIIHTHS